MAEPSQSEAAVAPPEAADQAAVFISYARADQGFARHLAEALQLKGVEVRADWQLVRGENYQNQLEDLMLGADVVVFIISSDSLGSAPCRSELDRAAQQNKRILPVVYRDPGSLKKELPPSLSLPQWTFLRTEDDFVAGVQGLVDAINTDFDLMPEHRRLLQAAEIWQRNNRSASYLLRKDGLKRTEAWRARTAVHPDRLPKPTPLQLEYIRASESARTRGSRIAVAVVGVIAVAMSVLAVVAILQRNEAKKETEEANRQRAEADRQRTEADRQKGIAQGETKIAQDQTTVAEARRRDAEREASIANSRALAAQSDQMLTLGD